MKHASLLIAPAFLLAGCQTVPAREPPQNESTAYMAHGTEPFWSLKIDGRRSMTFDRAGDKVVITTEMEARPSFNGWRYTSAKINADVTFTPCSDGMSDWTFRDTVSVMVGDKEYKGCGGGIVAPTSLEGTRWRFQSVNDAAIPVERNATLIFDKSRMSGSVGCNRLGADYRFEGKKLSVGPVMSTRMACGDPVGTQENAVVALLSAAFSTDFPGDGTMILSNDAGIRIILMQSM
jgi:heat shock protein HslJ